MTNNQLRNLLKKYFKNPLGKSLNQVARLSGISKPSLIKFLRGGTIKISEEKTKALIGIIAPWLLDPLVVAADIRKQLQMKCLSKEEIAEIERKTFEPIIPSTSPD